MKRWKFWAAATLLALPLPFYSLVKSVAQTSNPLPGYIWTFFGPTLGGGWGPPPNLQGGGATLMFPSSSWTANAASTVAWTIIPPAGHAYPCVTTQTQCFQETLNTAYAYGDSIELRCGGETNPFVQQPFIFANANINIHALAQRSIRAYGCNITFTATVRGYDFRINTMLDGASFYWDGQIVDVKDDLLTAEAVVAIAPNECPPAEGCGATVAANSKIFIAAVVTGATSPPGGYTGAAGSLVRVDVTGGSVNTNDIEVPELNGCGPCTGSRAAFGFFASNAGGGHGLIMDDLRFGFIHNVYNGVQIGAADGNQSLYARNRIEISYCSLVNPSGASGTCINDFGFNNEIHVHYADNTSGPYASVATLQAGSSLANLDIQTAVGYTNASPIIDNSGTATYRFNNNVLNEFRGSTALLTAGTQFNYGPILSTAGQATPSAGTNPTNGVGVLTFSGGTGTATINFGHPFGTSTGSAWTRTPWCDMSPTSGFFWTLTGISTTAATFTPSGSISATSSSRYTCSAQQ